MAKSGTSPCPSNPQAKSWRPCFNFAKGSCRFSSDCWYSHDVNAKSNASLTSKQPGSTNSTDVLLAKILEKLGLHESGPSRNSNISTTSVQPVAYNTSTTTPYFVNQQAHHLAPPPGFVYTLAQNQVAQQQPAYQLPVGPTIHTSGPGFPYVLAQAQPAQPQPVAQSVIQQPAQVFQPTGPAHSSAPPGFVTGPTDNTGQVTTLPHAFRVVTSQEPTTGACNMDTGASSHLNDSITSPSDVFNTCIYPSVSVGDGHTIPVTNTGHSILPTPHRPLHLNNVLITPHIIKNLIYVRQFVRDNNCTVEFDAFGFSIKDFMTRRVLLRCDSTGDLYPIMQPSPIPHAFLTSQHTWHQRLGHPGSEVLRRLVSRNLISCNKEKPPVLFHACQLGKHVRLPFVSSNTSVTSRFDIVHSDVWTSPIPSLSGFKYYVLFLDQYSHFVSVYPLVNKSDVLSKFMLFRTYVNTKFKCEIKSFQCDHGGEFENRALHTLFASKGIQFRFSCPKTSQQNGKS
ncbi:ribonuclease H-like domain-containing protein [Tanacetum coccineum]